MLRTLLVWSLAIGIVPTAVFAAQAETRTLKLYFIHTGEKAEITFKRNGRYDPAGLQKINRFLRDWRRNEPTKMNPRLLDLVWQAYQASGATGYINVVCGYRSPATNSMLRSRSNGVAKKSQHMLGNAMDFFIPGVPLKKLRDIGLKMQGGGVGYYPTSGSPFVHMDVGNVRHWPKMSRRELVAVFPNGRTLHVPSDGKPLPGFDEALAAYQSRKSAGNNALALVGTGKESGTKKSGKGLWATLFGRGGGADEEEDNAPDEEAAPVVRVAKNQQQPAAPVQQDDALPGVLADDDEAPKPETIVAALPQRDVPLPEVAPRPKAEVGAVQADEMPLTMSDAVADAADPGIAQEATGAVALRVPLPTWRPKYAPVSPDDPDPVSLALAEEDAAPVPSERPMAADVVGDLMAAQEDGTIAGGDADEANSDEEIASLINANEPRDLAAERAMESAPVTIVSADTKTTRKSARATPRDRKPAPASVVLPLQPADARWAFDKAYLEKGKDGKVVPAVAYNIVRTAPREVYANGFQPGGKELDANRFSGQAVAFLPVAKFETN